MIKATDIAGGFLFLIEEDSLLDLTLQLLFLCFKITLARVC